MQEVPWAFKIGRYKNDINENRTNGLMLTLCYLANKGKEECESFHIWIICSQVFRTKTNAFSFTLSKENGDMIFSIRHSTPFLMYFMLLTKSIPKTEKIVIKIILNQSLSLWASLAFIKMHILMALLLRCLLLNLIVSFKEREFFCFIWLIWSRTCLRSYIMYE